MELAALKKGRRAEGGSLINDESQARADAEASSPGRASATAYASPPPCRRPPPYRPYPPAYAYAQAQRQPCLQPSGYPHRRPLHRVTQQAPEPLTPHFLSSTCSTAGSLPLLRRDCLARSSRAKQPLRESSTTQSERLQPGSRRRRSKVKAKDGGGGEGNRQRRARVKEHKLEAKSDNTKQRWGYGNS